MAKTLEEPTVLGGRLALDALDLRDSLSDFIHAAWPLVEPGKRYIPNWHIDVIAEHLEAITAGDLQRLIINIPPRHMKSLAVAVFWPCWEWLTHPERRYLFTSYAQSLSTRDSLKCRRLIEHGGMAYAEPGASLLTEVTRESVTTWWNETMASRLNDPKTGAFVVVMQRLHEEDLTGILLERAATSTCACRPSTARPPVRLAPRPAHCGLRGTYAVALTEPAIYSSWETRPWGIRADAQKKAGRVG